MGILSKIENRLKLQARYRPLDTESPVSGVPAGRRFGLPGRLIRVMTLSLGYAKGLLKSDLEPFRLQIYVHYVISATPMIDPTQGCDDAQSADSIYI
jgi:hypothetical protein